MEVAIVILGIGAAIGIIVTAEQSKRKLRVLHQSRNKSEYNARRKSRYPNAEFDATDARSHPSKWHEY